MISAVPGLAAAVIHAALRMAFQKRNRDMAKFERMGCIGAETGETVEVTMLRMLGRKHQPHILGHACKEEPLAAAERAGVWCLDAEKLNFHPVLNKAAELGFLDEWVGSDVHVGHLFRSYH